MTLDPAMRAMLEMRAAAGDVPPFAELGIAGARQMSDAAAAALGKGPDLSHVEDLSFDGPAGKVGLRLYVPQGKLAGCMVFYHGGGWVVGSIAGYDPVCRRLARASGCAIMSIDYRLAPEHPFPAPVEDCYAALEWAFANHAELLGAPLPLLVAGDSAGGNLAAVVALAARDRKGPPIALQLLVFPVTDADFSRRSYVEHASDGLLTAEAMHWFWDQYVPDHAARTDPLASPLRSADLSGLPPALVEIAGYDPLRDEGEAYTARLAESGVEVKTRHWEGLCHGFFQLESLLPPAAAAVDAMGADVRDWLAGRAAAD